MGIFLTWVHVGTVESRGGIAGLTNKEKKGSAKSSYTGTLPDTRRDSIASSSNGRRSTPGHGVDVVLLPPNNAARINWKSRGRKELNSELIRPVNMG